ncbi:uncharacterized protein [Gorilla gorilla gorilla]|uniref:uncharacterized protein isoform X4 n=1 Tax=Gorilla gorilla gorilla TaxID=9595 RepID=UPI0024455FB5|nr:uncharacterized protein LOC109025816 isoform X3 [Gorilla gorilla gorilla]
MFSGYLIALKCHSPVAHFKFPMILRKTLASILKTENKNSRPLKVEGEEKLYRLLRSGDLFKFHQPHFYELSGLTCTSTLLSFALGRSIPGSFPAHIFVESPFSKLQCVICEDCDLPGTSPQGIHFRLLLNGQVFKIVLAVAKQVGTFTSSRSWKQRGLQKCLQHFQPQPTSETKILSGMRLTHLSST